MITDITIRNADTNAELEGDVSAELLSKSMTEETGTGAVPAYYDGKAWQYVAPCDVDFYRCQLRHDVITVYIEDIEGCSVEAGEGDGYDTGRIVDVDGEDVTVAWDSGTRTTQHVSVLCEPADGSWVAHRAELAREEAELAREEGRS